jgi:hypothetical protein
MRRFLLHIIPSGFKRVRHFGFLSAALKKEALERARSLLEQAQEELQQAYLSFQKWADDMALKCPKCEYGVLRLVALIPSWRWAQVGYG